MENYYEVNEETSLILYKDNGSEIVEGDRVFNLNLIPNNIISYSCEYFGSSLLGRIIGSKYMLGMGYKLPVIVEESREIIFMPTISAENKECSWVNIANIKNYKAHKNNVLVTFNSGIKRELPISYFSFENQFFRASKLLLILKMRKKTLK